MDANTIRTANGHEWTRIGDREWIRLHKAYGATGFEENLMQGRKG